MKIPDFIILGIVLAAMVGAAIYMHRRRKAGKCIGCSGDCAHCGYKT